MKIMTVCGSLKFQKEIEFAKSLNKKVIYYTDLIKKIIK